MHFGPSSKGHIWRCQRGHMGISGNYDLLSPKLTEKWVTTLWSSWHFKILRLKNHFSLYMQQLVEAIMADANNLAKYFKAPT